MPHAPLTRAAFDRLIATIADARDHYVDAENRTRDELETLEGYRYILQVLSLGSELFVEADPERPRFSEIVSPGRKFLGDNPDSLYQQAWIRGDRAYRIRGRRKEQCYISFTVHEADPNGGYGGRILADINDDALDIGSDGSFEFVLSPDQRAGTWVRLDPAAQLVIVRNYYLRKRSAHNDPSVFVELEIEPVDDAGPQPDSDDDSVAARIDMAAALLRATTIGLRQFGAPSTVPFASNEPNDVGTPFSFRNAGADAAGAVDIYYSSGNFDLGPDEAMVMDCEIPPSRFTNVMLWNVHMQTLEYRSRRSSLNQAQMVPEPDGSYRVVVCSRDPGVPNWLDCSRHRRGTVFWRFLLPESDPPRPRCRVVPVDQVRSLPAE